MTAPAQVLPVPTIGAAPRRLVIYKHIVVPHSQLKFALGQAFGDLYARINQSGVAPAGPPFVIYHGRSEPQVTWDIDVCAPVAEALSPTPEIGYRDMPADRVVKVLHVGPYESLGLAYEAIDTLVAAEQLTRTGPPREIYLSEPDVAPEKVQTLVEQPIL